MCGICGFHKITDRREASSVLSQMAVSLAHRGPDGKGVWLSEDHATGLANTRLAIIDIEGGKQPIRPADGRLVIVFNGELYNFVALRLQHLKPWDTSFLPGLILKLCSRHIGNGDTVAWSVFGGCSVLRSMTMRNKSVPCQRQDWYQAALLLFWAQRLLFRVRTKGTSLCA
jgi:hypothetical protein